MRRACVLGPHKHRVFPNQRFVPAEDTLERGCWHRLYPDQPRHPPSEAAASKRKLEARESASKRGHSLQYAQAEAPAAGVGAYFRPARPRPKRVLLLCTAHT